MKGKGIALLLALMLSMGFVGCESTPDGSSSGKSDTAKLAPSLLDGKVANLLEAEGIGILDKTDAATDVATPASARSIRTIVANADESKEVQKKAELAKKTEDGVEDIYFHEVKDGVKSYKELNKQHGKHHHGDVECNKDACDKISDEVAKEEAEGKADTVLSLDARVNKLYTVGDFTFLSVSSAVKGNAFVRTKQSTEQHLFKNEVFWRAQGFDTVVNIEDNFVEEGGWAFSWISIADEKGKQVGTIPIQVREGEKNYHQINYWSDDYNQSYVIDNRTGETYSLSQFKYVYSVSNGVIKVYDGASSGGFSYYKPVSTDEGLTIEKIQFPAEDEEFANHVGGCKTYADIYGNMVFSVNGLISGDSAEGIDEYGERKIGDKMIFAKKNSQIAEQLPDKAKYLYGTANRYFNGSDGRIYRVNFLGDVRNISVNVLDENCQWQEVEEDADVEFTYGYICAQVGDKPTDFAALLITCIKDGEAYYSTAAHNDGVRLWPQAFFINGEESYVGVVKIPTDKTKPNTVQDFIDEFRMKGYPLNNGKHAYTVYLVGKTQMLYFGRNEIVLKDVRTGQERSIQIELTTDNWRPDIVSGNVFVKDLGYFNVLKEVDFATFGKDSFSKEPIIYRSEFEEYYKLLKEKGA